MAKRKNPDQLKQGVATRKTRRAGKPEPRTKIAPVPGSPQEAATGHPEGPGHRPSRVVRAAFRRGTATLGQLMRILSSIERVLRSYLLQRARAAAQARDLERINAAADRLNAEAEEAMEYQTLNTSQSW